MTAGNGVGSTVVRRQLGRKLRRLREEAGKTHADVETAQIASATKMWRIETGKVPVKPGDIWALAHLYGANAEVTDALVQLAAGTRAAGWWEERIPAVASYLSMYIGLESASSSIQVFHPELVPGLLQTPDYARAVIRAGEDVTEEVVEQRVALRLARQRAVHEKPNPTRITAVLGAGALLLHVGSESVMDAQKRHLCELSNGDQVDVRILPWSAGPQQSMKGAFNVLDFDDPDDPALVYVDSHTAVRYVEQPDQVAAYRRLFDHLYGKAQPVGKYLS